MKKNEFSRADFCSQLDTVKCILESNSGCHVIIGGYFNVDLSRDCVNTAAVMEFCSQLKLCICCNIVTSAVKF